MGHHFAGFDCGGVDGSAVLQHPHFVAYGVSLGLVRCADNDESVVLPLSEFAVEDAAEADVQSYRGLVNDDHVRLPYEGTGERCLLRIST